MVVRDTDEQEATIPGGLHNGIAQDEDAKHRSMGGGGMNNLLVKTGFLGHSNTLFDAWLTAAAAQVGQVVLTLPTTLAQMGIAWGLISLTGFGLLGWWSVYLLSWLFFEYKARITRQQRTLKPGHVLQYHEVIGGVAGKPAEYFTFAFIIGSLFLAAVIQLVSSASNLYYANNNLNKREWAYVSGAISMLSIFLPNAGHFRAVSLLGMVSTTITAVYLLIAALSHGQACSPEYIAVIVHSSPAPIYANHFALSGLVLSIYDPMFNRDASLTVVNGVTHTGPKGNQKFFTGVTNTIFTFGGHGITIEIMDAMKRPRKFRYLYFLVVGYTLLIMIPSAVSVYWAYGDILLMRGNAISVVPESGWRTFAIVSMVVHQSMAYVLFAVPVFIAVEKAVGVHTGGYIWRTLVRIPVVLAIWLVALAIPFFGLINSVMGAFIVTVGAYAIPPAFFFVTYRKSIDRENSVQRPPLLLGHSWVVLFLVNALFVVGVTVVGLGWGGWATISNLIDQIDTVGLFASCYQCPPKK